MASPNTQMVAGGMPGMVQMDGKAIATNTQFQTQMDLAGAYTTKQDQKPFPQGLVVG